MSDVFKILLSGKKTRTQRSLDERARSILPKQESDFYSNDSSKTTLLDDGDDFDLEFGIEKDVANHLSDLKKISLRELDKKTPKEQLKILKTEYQRVYDKANHLNNLLVTSDKTNDDFMIKLRQSEKHTKDVRKLLRDIAFILPGSSELKNVIDKGSWTIDDVKYLFPDSLESLIKRLDNIDNLIEEHTLTLQKENEELKEKIIVYRKAMVEIDKLKAMILNKNANSTNAQTTYKEKTIEVPDIESDDKLNVEKETDSIEKQTEEPSASEVNSDPTKSENNKEEKHKLHFEEFYNDFQSNYEKNNKNKNTVEKETNYSGKDKVEKKINKDTSTTSKPTKANNQDKQVNKVDNHPLSPDFVEVEKESVSELFDDNIEDYINNLSYNQEFILGVIGRTGISRNPDLRTFLTKDEEGSKIYMKGRKFDYSSLSYDVSNLRDKGILLDEKINLGGNSGSSNMIVFELSDIGKQCYKSAFNDDPVIAEKRRIVKDHASLEHAYLIKDSANVFRELGYKVYTELSDVTFKVSNNRRKVFDFLIENDKKEIAHIEVERGTHNKDDFFDAMDKIYEITKSFYFITPNAQVKDKKTRQMFFSWITERLGGIQKADVVLHITTIDTLRKKPKNIWEITDLRNIEI